MDHYTWLRWSRIAISIAYVCLLTVIVADGNGSAFVKWLIGACFVWVLWRFDLKQIAKKAASRPPEAPAR